MSLNVLRRYFYDPLDHLISTGLLQASASQRFYQARHLATELDNTRQTTIFRHQAQALAEQQTSAASTGTTLLMTDRSQSLVQTMSGSGDRRVAFTAYGYHRVENGLTPRIGFNGEPQDEETGHYPLGQGNRFYNPVLMRFNSPDALSPFEEGGLNPYSYCGNDPVNFSDPTGQMFSPRWLQNTQLGRPSVIVRPALQRPITPPRTSVTTHSSAVTLDEPQASSNVARKSVITEPTARSSSTPRRKRPAFADEAVEFEFELREAVRQPRRSLGDVSERGQSHRNLMKNVRLFDKWMAAKRPNFQPKSTVAMRESYIEEAQTIKRLKTELRQAQARQSNLANNIKEFSVNEELSKVRTQTK